jgi:hypothetical protein
LKKLITVLTILKKKRIKRMIGWREKVHFVDFGLKNVDAKIDTGAKTSVIHCSLIEEVKIYRKRYVKFVPLDSGDLQFNGKEFIMPFTKEKTIKNSFGQEENRFVVQTRISLYGKSFLIDISLRDRSNMESPVLLGRSAIRNRFNVDVSKKYLAAKALLKKHRK